MRVQVLPAPHVSAISAAPSPSSSAELRAARMLSISAMTRALPLRLVRPFLLGRGALEQRLVVRPVPERDVDAVRRPRRGARRRTHESSPACGTERSRPRSSTITSDLSTREPDEIGDVDGVDPIVGDDDLRRIEIEAAREDRQPAQRRPLVVGEQVVAPVDRAPQRLLARHQSPGARRQQPEPIRQPIADLLGARASGCGRPRARARAACRRGADRSLRSPRHSRSVTSEAGTGLGRSVNEQLQRFGVDRQAWNRERDLAGDSELLAGRRQDRQRRRSGQQLRRDVRRSRRRRARSCPGRARRCVRRAHSGSSRSATVRAALDRRSPPTRCARRGLNRRSGRAPRTTAHRGSRSLPARPPRRTAGSCRIRRRRGRSRCGSSASAPSTASISRSRPMNDVSCTGRLASAASVGQQRLVDEREVGVAKLMHALGTLDVFEVVDSHVVEPRACGHADRRRDRGWPVTARLTSVRDGAQPRAPDDRGALIPVAVARSAPRRCAAPGERGTATTLGPTPAGARAHRRARPWRRANAATKLSPSPCSIGSTPSWRGHALAHHFAEAGHGGASSRRAATPKGASSPRCQPSRSVTVPVGTC